MRIGGPIPIQIARAYGVRPQRATAPSKPTSPVMPSAPAEETRSHEPSKNIQSLVGGNVRGPVDFSSTTVNATAQTPYQLYTRAADTIEAAVAIRLGRAVDVRG